MEDIENQEFVVLVVACAAHLQQHLYDLIELQSLEIKVLKKLYGKQPRPNKPDKLLLAASAKKISRKVLEKSEHIVTVDSFRRWYRELIAKTYTAHRKGRPRIDKELEAIIIKMALENESWGEDSICDRLRELGYELSDRTVSNVLARNGIPPSPEREKSTDWKKFIEAHWSDLVAIDFATFEVPDKKGLCTLRHHAFYAIHVDTREVNLLGVTNNLNGNWVENISRKLVDPFDGFFLGKKICLMDRDPNFTKEFKKMLNSIGCKAKVLPAKSPNLNAYIERFIGTARREVGRKIIPFSSKALHIMLKEHLIYYNTERTHQGLEGHCKPLVNKYDIFSGGKGELRKSSRLGNTLNFYYRDAV